MDQAEWEKILDYVDCHIHEKIAGRSGGGFLHQSGNNAVAGWKGADQR